MTTPAGDCLYVPVTQLDLVSKYIGGGEEQERTRLNKLGGTEWAKQKTRAQKAAKDLASGPHRAVRRAAAPPRLRLLSGFPLAAGI